MTDAPGQRLLLLDSATLYFRAFYAMPSSMRAPDGRPHGAVRGFLDMTATLVTRMRPGALVAAWDDDWRPAWRVELLASYKTHRVAAAGGDPDDGGAEEVPDGLGPQVGAIAELLAALGVPRSGAPGCEADDVIGTLATRAAARGVGVDVVTGDKDLYQLVDDAAAGGAGVRVVSITGGVRDAPVVDDAWLAEKYAVRSGAGYRDLAVLRGDASDGLPGVAGIGEKTAAVLLERFGDLTGLRAAAQDPTSALTPAQRRRLVEAGDYLDVAPRVVQVLTDVSEADLPHPVLPGAAPGADVTADLAAGVDRERLDALAAAWGVESSVQRLLTALRA